MCGLFGVLGPGILAADIDMLQDIAYISGLRGTDATGVLQVKRKGYGLSPEIVLEKCSNDISYFKWFHENHTDGNKKVLNDINAYLIAGHVRAATKGALSEDNAHPFELENIIGMHNGTVHGKEFSHETKTDSELLLSAIDQNGVEVLSTLDNKDAYALVIYNKNTDRVIFTRNHLRPLWFCVHAKRNVMFWASEDWMLRSIFKRHGEEIKNNALFYLNPGIVYSLSPKDFSNRSDAYFQTESIRKEVSKSGEEKKHSQGKGKEEGNEKAKGEDNKINKNITFLSKPNQKNKGRVKHIKCAGCEELLSLFEQYYAKSYGGNAMICRHCQKDFICEPMVKPNYLH